MSIRRATVDDLQGIAAIAAACDEAGPDSGSDPAYVGHLLSTGEVAVATGAAEAVVGFSASLPVGPSRLLTDLFVHPAHRDRGVGRALLGRVLPAGGRCVTFSSQDPRAMSLYGRHGMHPLWPLLYLRGSGAAAAAGRGERWEVTEASTDAVAGIARGFSGVDRAPTFTYWSARPGSRCVTVSEGRRVVAAGVVDVTDGRHELTHLCVANDSVAAGAVLAVVGWCAGDTRMCLPGPHPALPVLLEAGFRIEVHDLAMASAGVLVAPHCVYAPGLL